VKDELINVTICLVFLLHIETGNAEAAAAAAAAVVAVTR